MYTSIQYILNTIPGVNIYKILVLFIKIKLPDPIRIQNGAKWRNASTQYAELHHRRGRRRH